MTMVQSGYSTVNPPKGFSTQAVWDTTASLYKVPFGPCNIWFGYGAPAHAGSILDMAFDLDTPMIKINTDGSTTWAEMGDLT